jgi:hypothetical protein
MVDRERVITCRHSLCVDRTVLLHFQTILNKMVKHRSRTPTHKEKMQRAQSKTENLALFLLS